MNSSHVAILFRSLLITLCTVREHLTHTHWPISNGLVTAAERFLGRLHSIRRLVKPHTFNAVVINAASLPALAAYKGISGRVFAVAESSWSQLFHDCVSSFKFESLEEHFVSCGLDPSMREDYQDGLELWNIIYHDYMNNYVNIHYKSDLEISDGKELIQYWECLSNHLPYRDYCLGLLTKSNLVKQLTHSIFGVTKADELFGCATEYLLDTKALPNKLGVDANQADIQSCFQAF
eukprot:gene5486-7595_t